MHASWQALHSSQHRIALPPFSYRTRIDYIRLLLKTIPEELDQCMRSIAKGCEPAARQLQACAAAQKAEDAAVCHVARGDRPVCLLFLSQIGLILKCSPMMEKIMHRMS